MSKIWFHIENKVKNAELKEKIHNLLGPYYEFRVDAKFRPLTPDEKGNATEVVLTDPEIIDVINEGEEWSKCNNWICIDHGLNMYTRLRQKLTPIYSDKGKAGILRFTIQYRERESKLSWTDSYMDEQPICLQTKVSHPKVEEKKEEEKKSLE
jgi:hypothetical protein